MTELVTADAPLLAAETYEAMVWLRDLLEESLGVEVDTGGGSGCADLWFVRNGVEFYLTLAPSASDLRRRGVS